MTTIAFSYWLGGSTVRVTTRDVCKALWKHVMPVVIPLAPEMADQVVKAMCVLHSYLTQDGDNNVQALLNAGIEVRNDGLQGLANV